MCMQELFPDSSSCALQCAVKYPDTSVYNKDAVTPINHLWSTIVSEDRHITFIRELQWENDR